MPRKQNRLRLPPGAPLMSSPMAAVPPTSSLFALKPPQAPSSLALDQAVDVGCGRWAIWLGVLANTITYMGDMGSTPRSSVELECPHSTAPDFN